MISQRPLYTIEPAETENEPLQSISGYENMPLVSVEKAVTPLIDILPSIYKRIESAKEHYRNTMDGVTEDESIAIKLYTMSWTPFEECLYFALNSVLCSSDRKKLKPWFLYLRLLFNGLLRLPTVSDTVYRGVKMHFDEDFISKKKIVWWRFSSCTQALDVLQQEHFLGKKGARTMFIIKCHSGRDISKHSYFPREEEVLLLPETEFRIDKHLDQDDLHIITIQEIHSKPRQVVLTLEEISPFGKKECSLNVENFLLVAEPQFSSVTTKVKDISQASLPVTPKGGAQSSISISQYQNCRLEGTISDNRLNPELNLTSMGLVDQDMKIVAENAIRTTTVCDHFIRVNICEFLFDYSRRW